MKTPLNVLIFGLFLFLALVPPSFAAKSGGRARTQAEARIPPEADFESTAQNLIGQVRENNTTVISGIAQRWDVYLKSQGYADSSEEILQQQIADNPEPYVRGYLRLITEDQDQQILHGQRKRSADLFLRNKFEEGKKPTLMALLLSIGSDPSFADYARGTKAFDGAMVSNQVASSDAAASVLAKQGAKPAPNPGGKTTDTIGFPNFTNLWGDRSVRVLDNSVFMSVFNDEHGKFGGIWFLDPNTGYLKQLPKKELELSAKEQKEGKRVGVRLGDRKVWVDVKKSKEDYELALIENEQKKDKTTLNSLFKKRFDAVALQGTERGGALMEANGGKYYVYPQMSFKGDKRVISLGFWDAKVVDEFRGKEINLDSAYWVGSLFKPDAVTAIAEDQGKKYNYWSRSMPTVEMGPKKYYFKQQEGIGYKLMEEGPGGKEEPKEPLVELKNCDSDYMPFTTGYDRKQTANGWVFFDSQSGGQKSLCINGKALLQFSGYDVTIEETGDDLLLTYKESKNTSDYTYTYVHKKDAQGVKPPDGPIPHLESVAWILVNKPANNPDLVKDIKFFAKRGDPFDKALAFIPDASVLKQGAAKGILAEWFRRQAEEKSGEATAQKQEALIFPFVNGQLGDKVTVASWHCDVAAHNKLSTGLNPDAHDELQWKDLKAALSGGARGKEPVPGENPSGDGGAPRRERRAEPGGAADNREARKFFALGQKWYNEARAEKDPKIKYEEYGLAINEWTKAHRASKDPTFQQLVKNNIALARKERRENAPFMRKVIDNTTGALPYMWPSPFMSIKAATWMVQWMRRGSGDNSDQTPTQ